MLSVVVNMYVYSHEYEYNTLQWRLMWSNISVMTASVASTEVPVRY